MLLRRCCNKMATQHPLALYATVGELSQELPCLPLTASLAAIADLCLSDGDNDWVVIVDERGCPVRLVDRAGLLQGEPFEHRPLILSDATPIDVAVKQILAAERRPTRPLVCCDPLGRYVGLVRIERMLALGGTSEAQSPFRPNATPERPARKGRTRAPGQTHV